MMKRNILAVVIPALLVAGAANAAEIYNKTATNWTSMENGRRARLDHQWRHQQRRYHHARIGLKGETQINDQLIGYGQWEYNMDASNVEGSRPQNPSGVRRPESGRIRFIRLWP